MSHTCEQIRGSYWGIMVNDMYFCAALAAFRFLNASVHPSGGSTPFATLEIAADPVKVAAFPRGTMYKF